MAAPEVLFRPTKEFMDDRLFDLDNPRLNVDNGLRPFAEVKKRLAKEGIEARTIDRARDLAGARTIFFFEMPRPGDRFFPGCVESGLAERMRLFLYEPPATRPDNYEEARHADFGRVLTWRDDMVDGKKYVKNNFVMPFFKSEKIGFRADGTEFDKKKLLCLVSANKYSFHPDQLYSERVRAIRFMEKNHPDEFDLYGQRWDLPVVHSPLAERLGVNNISKGLNRLGKDSPTRLLPNWQYPSYRGPLPSKYPTLGHYRFSIAYENQKNVPGYVSEKMMDAFIGANVPVYLGASNIEKHVPPKCFVDLRKFTEGGRADYGRLHEYLRSVEKKEHEEFLSNIHAFLNSPKSDEFKMDFFIDNILSEVEKGE